MVLVKRPAAGHWFGLWASTLDRRWDVAVDLRGSLLTHFLWRRRAIVDRGAQPHVHRVVELGQLIGVAPPPAPRLWPLARHRDAASRLVPEGAPVLAIGPAANWPAKAWPLERFIELVRRLTRPGGALAGARVAIAAAPSERASIAPLLAAVPPAQLIDLAASDDLLLVHSCLARATLFVGNDSGLMHIAAASGAPTLGLFGPSDERRYAPWGAHTSCIRTKEGCAELLAAAKSGTTGPGALMTSLQVDAVEAAALSLLEARSQSPR
jgi:ADP-heptose:LPS heptosyltransferase